MSLTFCNLDEDSSVLLARCISKHLTSSFILTFSGEIGAGKTTIIREIIKSLGVNAKIKSPTFSLVESYNVDKINIHHFDLYRIHDPFELEYIGFRDYFKDSNILFIEWSQRAEQLINEIDIAINLSILETGKRNIKITGLTNKGMILMEKLALTFKH